MEPESVIAYVDGFNFYHGLMDRGWGRYRWLDFRALVTKFVLDSQELRDLKYFTSMLSHEPERLARQNIYLKALAKHCDLEPIAGYFQRRDVQCQVCEGWYKRPQEKQTDVNIATHLVADAFDGLLTTAVLVCADSDLAPAVAYIKERFGIAVAYIKERFGIRVVLIDPPRRHSDELASLADAHLHFPRVWLRDCQLPNPVEYQPRPGRVRRIHRPPDWDPN